MIGEDTVIKFTGCTKLKAYTIFIRRGGASKHGVDEAERLLHVIFILIIYKDALYVLD